MSDEQYQELKELIAQLDEAMTWRPCKNGHEFIWSSTTTQAMQPPDWVRCQCGLVTWGEASRVSPISVEVNQ